MIGQTVSHYRIVARIGSGGMAVVYRAEDLKLGRQVALKFLPAERGLDEIARARLLREAKTASSIDHPNICTIYDIDETDDGRLFIAMALYDGRTVQDLLAAGPLPVTEAIEITAQAAEGLGAAHRLGIVHRDVKPSNLLVASGVVKILDFGLAILSGDTRLTRAGTVVGTVSYMPPEMARGEDAAAAADVWSLGVVLHEMLGGHNPFDRGMLQPTMQAVQDDDAAPPARPEESLPDGLQRILSRALTKDPSHRYRDGYALAVDLRTLQRAAGLQGAMLPPDRSAEETTVTLPEVAPARRPRRRGGVLGAAIWLALLALVPLALWHPWRPRRSLPVASAPARAERVRVGVLLPVVTGAGDDSSDLPRLVQAMLVESLAGVQEFGVLDALSLNGRLERSLGSASPERGPALLHELSEAGVSQVLDGTIDATAAGRRISISIVDLNSGEILFSHHEDVHREVDLPGAMSSLAGALVGFLQVKVLNLDTDRDLRPYVLARTRNVEAIKAFMQANQYAYRAESGAERYLLRAIELDPGFIAPRLWLISGFVPQGRLDEARRQLAELQGLEERANPFEQAMIAWAASYIGGNLADQGRNLEIALRFSPGNNILLMNLAGVRYEMGDYAGAVAAIAPAVAAGFRYPECRVILAGARIQLGQLDQARRDLEGGLALQPVSVNSYGLLEALHLARGDAEEAARFASLLATRRASMPKSAGREEPASTSLGDCYERIARECDASARPERGVAVLERAVRYEPADAEHRAALSDAYRKTGRIEEAETAARAGVRLGPRNPRAHLALARALDAQGDRSGAIPHYREFTTLDPAAEEGPDVKRRLGELERTDEPRQW